MISLTFTNTPSPIPGTYRSPFLSARMARLGKYMPHLTKRDGNSGAKSLCGGGATFNPTTSMSSSAAPSQNLHESFHSSPTPPERPPKKPHLRSYSHQIGAEDGENNTPPPTLPRAPVRPPQTNNTNSSISIENGMGLTCHVVSAPPPVPSKPVVGVPVKAGIAVARCASPDLPPPPPPIIPEEVEVINSELPLPPPPTLNEVTEASNNHILGPRSRSVSGLSSYLHKDGYMAARKEKTLGYEGRYRRTLSPSGLGSKSGDDVTTSSTTSISNATSTGKLDTSLSPSAWEKYHNIRPPSTTVIFSSQEIAKGASPFTRSISCDSNLFNNKTGFTQSSIPPPVAQVAPLRDSYTSPPSPPTSLKEERPSLMVAPLHFDHNKENIPEQREEEEEEQVDEEDKKLDDPKETVEKSEVCLRVNCTSDVASQTDTAAASSAEASKKKCSSTSSSSSSINADTPALLDTPSRSSSSSSRATSSSSSSFDDSSVSTKGTMTVVSASYTGRQKRQEELECEELSRRLVQHLPNGDKLQKILVPLPEHKTTADYMGGLFQLEVELKVEKETNTSARSSPDLLQSLPKKGATPPASPTPTEVKRVNGHAPLPADSAYFTTSEVKAKFLTQYVNDMNKNDSLIGRSQDSQELNKQKEMLVSRISRKLDILKEEQLEIRKEIESNEQLGEEVIERVRAAATPSEFDKFKGHVAKIEKVTSLLLGLSGRLARAENALMSLAENSNPQERKILESKRDKLKEQLEEAKVLKEYTDGTSAAVSAILRKYLSPEAYADYTHFVKMKAKLIIDAREIDDKIKLGDEQMVALRDTLNYSPSS